MKPKKTNKEIQEIFKEGNFIARALHVSDATINNEGQLTLQMDEVHNEMQFLKTKKTDGIRKNVERDGQRNRSATLIVPDVDMDLFSDVGLVYDGDKSTIRAYMHHDSVTISGTQHKGFYNIKDDKKHFEPIISKKKFIDEYKAYRERTDNTRDEHTRYNEVLGNFFPESVVGLVGRDNSSATKFKLLCLKQTMQEQYGYDLPITVMSYGQIRVWEPDLKEIEELVQAQVNKLAKKTNNIPKEAITQQILKKIGYQARGVDAKKNIIFTQNANEMCFEEAVDCISKITNIDKGSKFSYGIKGRLENVIKERRKKEGLSQLSDIESHIVQKEDISNLIKLLDTEMHNKNISSQDLTDRETSKLTDQIFHSANKSRTGEEQYVKIEHFKNLQSGRVQEFINKIKSLVVNDMSLGKSYSAKTEKRGAQKKKFVEVIQTLRKNQIRKR